MKFFKTCHYFATSAIMLLAVSCASTTTQSSTGELIDDTVITAKEKTAIFNSAELSASEINVETFKGVVQLSGFVSDRSDIALAGAVTRAITGVTSVKNDIVLK